MSDDLMKPNFNIFAVVPINTSPKTRNGYVEILMKVAGLSRVAFSQMKVGFFCWKNEIMCSSKDQ